MAHPRQTIRDEIHSILTAAQATIDAAAGQAVTIYNARILTINDQNLPAVTVRYTEDQGGEDIDQKDQTPGDYNHSERELIISIEVMTMRDDEKASADQNDDICNAIEDVMAQNLDLNGNAANTEFYRVRFRSDPEGNRPARFIENLMRVFYITNKGA